MFHRLIFAAAAAICFIGHPSHQELTAYDCSTGTTEFNIDQSKLLPSCEAITETRTVWADVVERPSPQTVRAYRCLITFTQFLVDAQGSRRQVSKGTQIIGREACTKAHKTKAIVLLKSHIPFLETNGTIVHTISMIHPEEVEEDAPEENGETLNEEIQVDEDSDGSEHHLSRISGKQWPPVPSGEIGYHPRPLPVVAPPPPPYLPSLFYVPQPHPPPPPQVYLGKPPEPTVRYSPMEPQEKEDEAGDVHEGNRREYHYERTYQITLSEETGTVDFDTDIVRFGSVACDYSELCCKEEGELFWTADHSDNHKQLIIYRGAIVLVTTNASRIAPEITYAVLDHNGQVFVLKSFGTGNHPTEFQTEIKDLYIIPKVGPNFLIGIKSSSFLRDDPSNDERWKKVYSETTGFEKVHAVEVVKRLCKKDKTALWSSFDDSLTLSYPKLQRKGLIVSKFARFAIQECTRTKVHLREADGCFKEIIPVTDEENNEKFLNADSRILSTNAGEVECENITFKESAEVIKPILTPSWSHSRDQSYDGWFIVICVGLVLLAVIAFACLVLCVVTYCSGIRYSVVSQSRRKDEGKNGVVFVAS